VYCTTHRKLTISAEPCVNEVDVSVHVVGLPLPLRIWQTVTGAVDWLGSDSVKLAKIPGSWLIVTDRPPTVTVPDREAPGLADALTTAVPLPVPLEVVVRKDELLDALHPQFESPVTVMLTLPPPLFAFALDGETVTLQPDGADSAAAACVKVTAMPLTAMLAERAAPVFAAML
jgi:hypothetical protein